MKTEPCLISQLRRGDVYIGSDGRTRLQVTHDARSHPLGWVQVRNLTMTAADMEEAIERGDVEPGYHDPRVGFIGRGRARGHELVNRVVR